MAYRQIFGVLSLGFTISVMSACSGSNKSNGDVSKNTTNVEAAGNVGVGTTGQVTAKSLSTMCEVAAAHTCYESDNIAADQTGAASAACSQQKGVFTANATCLRTDLVGGCLQSGSLTTGVTRSIVWQYAPAFTVEQVKATCQSSGQSFVAPSDVASYGSEAEATIFAMCNVSAASSCYEYSDLPVAQTSTASTACDGVSGVFTAKATCSRTNAVGACAKSGGLATGKTLLMVWQYAPAFTKEKVMAACAAAGESFVASVPTQSP